MKKYLSTVIVLAAVAGFSGSAFAASQTSTLDVSVNVVEVCSMSVTGITFPDYDGNAVFADGNLTVTCGNNIVYQAAADAGLHYDGGTLRRNVSNGSDLLQYTLWKDSLFSEEWGDYGYGDTYPLGFVIGGVGSGAPQSHTIYGALGGLGLIGPAGVYSDTVVVTLNY